MQDLNRDKQVELITAGKDRTQIFKFKRDLQISKLTEINQGGSLAVGDLNQDGHAVPEMVRCICNLAHSVANRSSTVQSEFLRKRPDCSFWILMATEIWI